MLSKEDLLSEFYGTYSTIFAKISTRLFEKPCIFVNIMYAYAKPTKEEKNSERLS